MVPISSPVCLCVYSLLTCQEGRPPKQLTFFYVARRFTAEHPPIVKVRKKKNLTGGSASGG